MRKIGFGFITECIKNEFRHAAAAKWNLISESDTQLKQYQLIKLLAQDETLNLILMGSKFKSALK